MGLKQTIKGWFTKQSKVNLTGNWQSRSINGLYTANNKDLNKIATKVNEIENVINNLPPPTPPVDLSEYAKKNIDNDFVNQSIKGDAPYLQFKAANGVRVGYTGNPSAANNNIETKAEHGDYYLSARENVVLNPTNGNAIYSKTPTDNNEITNKAYVDQQITTADQSLKGLIQTVKNKADNLENEMLNVPKLAGLNSFTGTNTFGTHVIIGNNDAKYVDPNYVPTNDGEFASKKYVDQNSGGTFHQFNVRDQGDTYTYRLNLTSIGLDPNKWYIFQVFVINGIDGVQVGGVVTGKYWNYNSIYQRKGELLVEVTTKNYGINPKRNTLMFFVKVLGEFTPIQTLDEDDENVKL